jgi:hypothetical protein
MRLTLEDAMEAIYSIEQNCSIYVGSDWDGGWRVTLGGAQRKAFLAETTVVSLRQAAEWLHEQALLHFDGYGKRLGVTITRSSP